MKNICILDAKTLGEDADLSVFNKFGQVSLYQTTTPDEVIERIKDQNIIITNKVVLNETNLKHAPGVELICVAATGMNNIDLEYAKSKNIKVCNVAGYSTYSVAQHTFSLLFYLIESLSYYDEFFKSNQYANSDIFTHLGKPFWEIRDKTWGIIGLGTIGKTVANIARSFGSNVIYYSTSGKNNNEDYTRVALADLLKSADIISIHAPLNPQTYNLITYNELKQMKNNAILLNLGRGGIVNEADLARALDENLIGAAGLDVLESEPVKGDNPLLHIKNSDRLFVTPHIAWASVEARKVLVNQIAANIEAHINGK
ncbi:MAG: D-2-hydroxyacid dehydrogenase [Syntrophomonadaceae bacterium]|nr:D-2-hydroxyacid dehydrogenase [Syntrophomonadaceae bacterium]MDD4550216.1 D-2-hydroxyacid dehydrogenase [Syntrophomonadaceae bacterium]